MPEQQQPAVNGEAATAGDAAAPPKTAKQLEKEAKKAEKLAKLQAKLDKKAAAPPATAEKKEKPEVNSNKIFNGSGVRNSSTEKALLNV